MVVSERDSTLTDGSWSEQSSTVSDSTVQNRRLLPPKPDPPRRYDPAPRLTPSRSNPNLQSFPTAGQYVPSAAPLPTPLQNMRAAPQRSLVDLYQPLSEQPRRFPRGAGSSKPVIETAMWTTPDRSRWFSVSLNCDSTSSLWPSLLASPQPMLMPLSFTAVSLFFTAFTLRVFRLCMNRWHFLLPRRLAYRCDFCALRRCCTFWFVALKGFLSFLASHRFVSTESEKVPPHSAFTITRLCEKTTLQHGKLSLL